ncbi:MAG: hypothetical protein Q9169_008185 [Polycauliona sp. 2 TL-2023]
MLASKVVLLVRDAKTSKILRSPPEEQLWLHREKTGLGRASKNEWDIKAEVGEKFFEQGIVSRYILCQVLPNMRAVEKNRDWHFGFNDYYDVILWDLEPGKNRAHLYNLCFETLLKAHRMTSMQDQYRPAKSLLKTIAHDLETMRTRDLKPGEQSMSIWEEIEMGRNRMLNYEGTTLEEQVAPDLDPRFFYGEADVLEDKVLFPEESSAEPTNALYSGTVNALEHFGNDGPNWERFVHDLETDEELSSDESDQTDDHLLEDGSESNHHLLKDGPASDDDDEWEDEITNEGELERAMETKKRTANNKGNDALMKRGQTAEEILSSIYSKEQIKDLNVLHYWKPPRDFCANVKADFDMFFDREKSRPFKAGWHAADLAPGGPERWKETQTIIDQMKNFIMDSHDRFKHYHIVRFMDVHPDKHRRVVKDALDACAMTLLFFSTDFLSSEHGSPHKDSLLFNQRERALNPPPRRPLTSDANKPKSFWDEFDAHFKSHRVSDYPPEWDIAIRPIIARLYKAGVIGSTFLPYDNTPGKAMAVPTGPSGHRDLYIDFRVLAPEISFARHVNRPPSKDWLLAQIHAFAKKHPNARFSALRLWSAPHFYPLMVAYERRTFTAFTDFRGRGWEWNFVPKDMLHSETSMHHTASQRLKVFEKQLGERVLHMRDLFVVMGVDEGDCERLTGAAVFMVQTEPWRLEVDLWKSFVNVDEGFLEWVDGLGRGWLD